MVWRGLIYQGIDFSNKYIVSEYGDVKNIQTEIVLKPHVNKGGYKYVCISLNKALGMGKRKVILIHKAVAYNYLKNPNNYNTVDHIDADKTNNHFSNLEWVTPKENTLRAYKKGLIKKITNNPHQKLTEIQVKEIKALLKESKYTHKEIAIMYNVTRGNITQIANGQIYKWVS